MLARLWVNSHSSLPLWIAAVKGLGNDLLEQNSDILETAEMAQG